MEFRTLKIKLDYRRILMSVVFLYSTFIEEVLIYVGIESDSQSKIIIHKHNTKSMLGDAPAKDFEAWYYIHSHKTFFTTCT